MRNLFKLEIGMGPDGKDMKTVYAHFQQLRMFLITVHSDSFLPNGSTVTFDDLIIRYLENSTSSWQTHHGIFI